MYRLYPRLGLSQLLEFSALITYKSDCFKSTDTRLLIIAPTLKIREECQRASTTSKARGCIFMPFDICSVVAVTPAKRAETADRAAKF